MTKYLRQTTLKGRKSILAQFQGFSPHLLSTMVLWLWWGQTWWMGMHGAARMLPQRPRRPQRVHQWGSQCHITRVGPSLVTWLPYTRSLKGLTPPTSANAGTKLSRHESVRIFKRHCLFLNENSASMLWIFLSCFCVGGMSHFICLLILLPVAFVRQKVCICAQQNLSVIDGICLLFLVLIFKHPCFFPIEPYFT